MGRSDEAGRADGGGGDPGFARAGAGGRGHLATRNLARMAERLWRGPSQVPANEPGRARRIAVGAAAIAILVAGLVLYVDPVVSPVVNLPGPVRTAFRSLTRLGKSDWFLIPAAALGITLLIADWRRPARRVAAAWTRVGELVVFVFIAFTASGVATTLLKVLIGRARPKAADGLLDLAPLSLDYAHLSFPSGHATTAGAAYMTVALIAYRRPGVAALVALAAVFVAASRVALGVHYVSDVVAGFVIGAGSTRLCAEAFARRGIAFRSRSHGSLTRTMMRWPGAGAMWTGLRAALAARDHGMTAITFAPPLPRHGLFLAGAPAIDWRYDMKRIVMLSAVAAVLFGTLVIVEVVKSEEPLSATEVIMELIEIGLLALAVVATAWVSLETRDMRRERADLLNDLARARSEGDRWRAAARAHIDGLSRAIRAQFEAWKLSESEADVAILMLKGLSHKEIARFRATSEATVRQQATAIYRKSGLASRVELAAFFLEDLLSPGPAELGDRPSLTLVEPKA